MALVEVMGEGEESRGLSPRDPVCFQAHGNMEIPNLGTGSQEEPMRDKCHYALSHNGPSLSLSLIYLTQAATSLS